LKEMGEESPILLYYGAELFQSGKLI